MVCEALDPVAGGASSDRTAPGTELEEPQLSTNQYNLLSPHPHMYKECVGVRTCDWCRVPVSALPTRPTSPSPASLFQATSLHIRIDMCTLLCNVSHQQGNIILARGPKDGETWTSIKSRALYTGCLVSLTEPVTSGLRSFKCQRVL